MGVCTSKEKKKVQSNLAETFAKTRFYQQKYMNEVFVPDTRNDLKITNIKSSQSVEGIQNSAQHLRRKGVSVNRLALSGIKNGGIPIFSIKQINYKDSFRQKYHKVIGLLMQNTDLSIMQNNQNQQLVICQHTKDQEYIKWLKLKNFENDQIIKIQEVQFFDEEYFIIFDYWKDDNLFNIENKALLFYQMIEAIQYLHDNDLRHNSLTLNSFKLTNKFGTLKLVEIEQIYKPRESNIEIWKYSSPEALTIPNNRTKERDIWALGVIFLELLLGQYPFLQAQQPNQLNIRRLFAALKNLTEKTIENIIQNLDKDIQQLLLGMLNLNSVDRFQISDCKINKWLIENLKIYETDLQAPLINMKQNKRLYYEKCIARYYLLRKIDFSQFNKLFQLFQKINTEQSNFITTVQIMDYYNSIFLPENLKDEIIYFVYSLQKDLEFDHFHFIGMTCNFNIDKIHQYYFYHVNSDVSLKKYLNSLHINKKDLKIIKSDFSDEELNQNLSFDFFIKYFI